MSRRRPTRTRPVAAGRSGGRWGAGRVGGRRGGGGGRAGEAAPRPRRSEQRALGLDMKVRQAIERGDFDNLPGAGKPLPGLDGNHDPDWWIKKLIAREQIPGVLPPALQLRKDDTELDARLDQETTEAAVRHLVDD